ncbi:MULTISPECIES: TetR/AcrR family transcriptional regulator [Pantoea]|jgi:AcrR family transcriptional regulator|uniref:Helix-turn-helix domain-containing protein n=2 Tax=Pantoea TaxID=53335 RepID=A0AAU7TSI8_9GAMM|nr:MULTISPECIES: TetR/AcrR family transcriptional regulator [Pantoea]MBD9658223.1 TetR/AcrR family transcriptional regulator [Pantoea sp. PNT03]WFL66271.1 helix-turn-helix domain containing protein [Pantoea sp. X85]
MLEPLIFDATASARDRILLCAQQLFYQQGIRATGVDKVIAQAGVTKVTFYRHFPAKNALVLAFLQQRHQRWMLAFRHALNQHAALIDALPAALLSWFRDDDYRGCAFINTAAELGDTLAEASELIRQHKREMAQAISDKLMPDQQVKTAQIVLLVEGAIVQVQIGEEAERVVDVLRAALDALLKTGA